MLTILKNTNADTLTQIAEEKKVRGTDELFLVFPLGSQFDHLIVQQLESLGVFVLVADPSSLTASD